MLRTKTITETREVQTLHCDICGDEKDDRDQLVRCESCGKEVCGYRCRREAMIENQPLLKAMLCAECVKAKLDADTVGRLTAIAIQIDNLERERDVIRRDWREKNCKP